MLNDFACNCPVYVACGFVDLRKGIDGLAGIVESQFQMDPFQRALFLFCGRKKDRLKGLYWEGDGFVMVYKRLENGRFQWPTFDSLLSLARAYTSGCSSLTYPESSWNAVLFVRGWGFRCRKDALRLHTQTGEFFFVTVDNLL